MLANFAERLSIKVVGVEGWYLEQIKSIHVNGPSLLDVSSYKTVLTTCEKPPANLQAAIGLAIEK